jgi:hypothetical protein
VVLEVFPRVLEVVLRLCRDHASNITLTVRGCCVSHTSFHARLELQGRHRPVGR